MIKIPKLYVGSMNDGAFIIDKKPSPVPIDYHNPNRGKDIEIVIPCRSNFELANRLVDTWNKELEK